MSDETLSPEQPVKSPTQILKDGLFWVYLEKELAEPGYYVLKTNSYEAEKLQQQWRYGGEILRVLTELKLTIWLLDQIPETEEMPSDEFGPEDVMLYYEGIFLELTHQLKDKLTCLLELLFGLPKKASKEGSVTRLRNILEKAEEAGLDLKPELRAWGAEEKNPGVIEAIVSILTKRSHHHHFLSSTPLNKFYQDVKFSKFLGQNQTQGLLTDFGKQRIKEIGEGGLSSLRAEARGKMQSSLEDIQKNVDSIAKKVIAHFKLAHSQEQFAELYRKKQELDARLEIHNQTDIKKIPPRLKTSVDKLTQKLSDDSVPIVSLYMIGSAARGQVVPTHSDVNICLIVKDEPTKVEALSRSPYRYPLAVEMFTDEEFKSEADLRARKYRFICKKDGVLIFGQDLIGDEKFPKPGAELAWLLNFDFVEKITAIETLAKDNPNASVEDVGRYSHRAIKILLDMIFGIAMTNDPHYFHNRQERIAFIEEAFPQNEEMMNLYKKLLLSAGIGNMDGLVGLIEHCKKNGSEMLGEIQAIVAKLNQPKVSDKD